MPLNGAAVHTFNRDFMRALLFALFLIVLPGSIKAQAAPVAGAQRATRAELAERLQQLEGLVASAGKADQRSKLEAEQSAIRARLENGDFKVGDRFVMTVRFDSVRVDTASVRDSLVVSILNLPDLRLQGVLRSELDEKLNQHVARYIRNASVRSNVLTRIAILGAVRAPGYYYASPDRPISDLVMLAGGPDVTANLKQFTVRRGMTEIISERDSREAISRGVTIEQLDIQSGDEVRIGAKRQIPWSMILRLAVLIAGVAFSLLQFITWYYNRQDSL